MYLWYYLLYLFTQKTKKEWLEEDDSAKNVLKDFLVRYCRLQGMLYSRVGMEKFEFLTAQCMMDFQLLMEDEFITPRLAVQMITYLIFVIFHSYNAFLREIQQKLQDEASKKSASAVPKTAAILGLLQSQANSNGNGHGQSKTASVSAGKLRKEHPFGTFANVGTVGRKALDLMLDITGYLLQEMSQSLDHLPFLSCVAVVCSWLAKYPSLVRDNPSESAKFFCHRLVQMANIIVFYSYIGFATSPTVLVASDDFEKHETKDQRNGNAAEADLFGNKFDKESAVGVLNDLKGFSYIERLSKFHDWLYKNKYCGNANGNSSQEQVSNILPWLLDKMLSSAGILLDRDPVKETSFTMPKLPGEMLLKTSLTNGFTEVTTKQQSIIWKDKADSPKKWCYAVNNDVFLKAFPGTEMTSERKGKYPSARSEHTPYLYSIDSPPPNTTIVIDGPNVAMACGEHSEFKVEGIMQAIEHFRSKHCRTIVLMPAFYLEYDNNQKPKKNGADTQASRKPDNVLLLNQLKEKKLLFTTPSGDYDDSYAIEFAKKLEHGYILSNDRYRDAVFKKWQCYECSEANEPREQFCKCCHARRPKVISKKTYFFFFLSNITHLSML
ncbi:hypothetical protein RFI_09343 [Reticulomyxa filosa]|uniref:RanBP2-type domain-containing protein n=1 Tax=Reticulomyxa filosa TaxID=46433 RepID=X6NP36_RETFI|nr:hypothetical protein RFI_09343 [Reticulomyxa filosa]|eukprot:ETO27786.1 hypothetical protein RFI_09343 [Reticulomyxa filosa]